MIDLLQISSRYLNRDLYLSPSQHKKSFVASAQDRLIQQDTTHYRVYEPALGLQGARTAFFHNAIGGYHGAKPRRFEELIDLFQVQKRESILNILNVKYILFTNENGEEEALQNPKNLGEAWMIKQLHPQKTPNEAYMAMTTTEFNSSAIIESHDQNLPLNYSIDPSAQIALVENTPNTNGIYFHQSKTPLWCFPKCIINMVGWHESMDEKPK